MKNIVGMDFKYIVSVDYNMAYHCSEKGCGQICRCGTIEDKK